MTTTTHRFTRKLLLLLFLAAPCFAGEAAPPQDGSVLPRHPLPFAGKLEPTEAASTGVFPTPVRAPQGAPNILLVMTDDVGFSASSAFGGPVPTPNLDRLADAGLRYNRFHTTGICSPTRAALLTGRNHHAVGSGILVEMASPFPGYTSVIPPSAATIARILRDNGYSTAMLGKDHNVPAAERSSAGPFHNWPVGWGFEYFYGFVNGDTDQYQPALWEGTVPVDGSDRGPDYILDKDLANHAITWLHNQKAAFPDKPFFMYYAPGTAHAPLQVPADWIARFKGRFDQGWDALREETLAREKSMGIVPGNTQLAARPDQIPAWDSLDADQKRIAARYMEVFAATLAYQDAQIGRLLDEIGRMGLADNTLVVFIEGDNGASGEGGPQGTLNEMAHLSSPLGEFHVDPAWLADNLDILGGPKTYQGYPVGWAFATNTPLPWIKQIASHLGGVRNGLVISWPQHIADHGAIRTQYHHIIDIMPTLLQAAGVKAPEVVDGIAQQPIDGTSMVYSFDHPDAPSTRRTQYYEILGNRGIYHDGWLANTTPRNMPWNLSRVGAGSDTSTYTWELYNLDDDFSQSQDLARERPEKLKEMQALFDEEARRYNVYPIQDSGGMVRAMRMLRAGGSMRSDYVYWGPDVSMSMMNAPPMFFLPFSLEADIEVPASGASGVLVGAGSWFGGWSFYLDDGVPVAMAAVSPLPGGQSRIAASRALAPGKHSVAYRFLPAGPGGEVVISVDGTEVARGPVARRPMIMAGNGETFDTGRDTNVPVSTDYADEGVFTGTIDRIEVKLLMGKKGKGAKKAKQEAAAH